MEKKHKPLIVAIEKKQLKSDCLGLYLSGQRCAWTKRNVVAILHSNLEPLCFEWQPEGHQIASCR